RAVHVEPVGTVDLPEPGVLGTPAVVHGHGPLRDGGRRVCRHVGLLILERRIPEGQRVEIRLDACAVPLRRRHRRMAARRGPHLLHALAIDLEGYRCRREAHALAERPFDVVAVSVPVIAHVLGEMVHVEAAFGDILLELAWVDVAATEVTSVLAAMARERADAGPALMVDEIIR